MPDWWLVSSHEHACVITRWAAKAHCSLSACVEESQGGSDLFADTQLQSCGEIWITQPRLHLVIFPRLHAQWRWAGILLQTHALNGDEVQGDADESTWGPWSLCWLGSLSPLTSVPLNSASIPSVHPPSPPPATSRSAPLLYVLCRWALLLYAHFINIYRNAGHRQPRRNSV